MRRTSRTSSLQAHTTRSTHRLQVTNIQNRSGLNRKCRFREEQILKTSGIDFKRQRLDTSERLRRIVEKDLLSEAGDGHFTQETRSTTEKL